MLCYFTSVSAMSYKTYTGPCLIWHALGFNLIKFPAVANHSNISQADISTSSYFITVVNTTQELYSLAYQAGYTILEVLV